MKLSEATINKTIRNPQWIEQHADYLRDIFPSFWAPSRELGERQGLLILQLNGLGIPADNTKDLAVVLSELDKAGFIQSGKSNDDGHSVFRINPQFGNTIVISA